MYIATLSHVHRFLPCTARDATKTVYCMNAADEMRNFIKLRNSELCVNRSLTVKGFAVKLTFPIDQTQTSSVTEYWYVLHEFNKPKHIRYNDTAHNTT